ncbi:MAG: hypothetical protein QM490_02280 [Candidatus Gracilibacteria bacterium]
MEAFIKEKIEGKKFELLIDTNIFNKYIILKSAHNFLDKGYFLFKQNKDKNIIMQFTFKEGIGDKPEKIILDFSDELLNNILREKVFEENKEVRTEIITSAIKNSLREAELPNKWKGYDSVEENYFEKNNLNEEDNAIDFDKDIDEILKEIENDPELKIDEDEIAKILKEIEDETENENNNVEETPIISVDTDAVKEMKKKFKK